MIRKLARVLKNLNFIRLGLLAEALPKRNLIKKTYIELELINAPELT